MTSLCIKEEACRHGQTEKLIALLKNRRKYELLMG